MKYSTEITIDLPRQRVIELFDNEENIFKWMEGLKSFDHLEGEPGKVGAKSEMKFEMGKRKIEMVETILERDLPDSFKMSYESAGVYNEVGNFFSEIDADHTLYRTEHYFRFDGWGMKVMAFLMPGLFKKQSAKYMKDFKAFAEAE